MRFSNAVPDVPRHDGEEIAALWRSFKVDGDRCARERLAHLYFPLVKHVARRLASTLSRQAELDDLEGYGAEGLLDAIDRFDPGRGVQFTTFAAHRIRGAVYDGIRAADWVPRSVRRKAREIQTVDADLAAAHGRAPTEEEEAAALDLELHVLRAAKAQVAAGHLVSLEPTHATGDGFPTFEPTADDEPLADLLAAETRALVRAAVRRLPDRERAVTAMSFGNEMTLSEIGRTLGVTESRVCQIRASALSRLRGYVQAQGIRPEGAGRPQVVAAGVR